MNFGSEAIGSRRGGVDEPHRVRPDRAYRTFSVAAFPMLRRALCGSKGAVPPIDKQTVFSLTMIPAPMTAMTVEVMKAEAIALSMGIEKRDPAHMAAALQ